MKQVSRKIITIGLAFVMLCSILAFSGCNEQFTNEEHIERISQRVQHRFLSGMLPYANLYTDFSVTILYSFSGMPIFFMVEFEPDGFLYGQIHRNNYYIVRFVGGSNWGEHGWGWNINNYITDIDMHVENAETHFRSHFYVAGITDERKFFSFSTFKDLVVSRTHHAVLRNDVLICILTDREYVHFQEGNRRLRLSRAIRDNQL